MAIYSNYDKETYLVLSNNDDKIMSIIKCPAGRTEITEIIQRAIKDDEQCDSVKITNSFILNNKSTHYILSVALLNKTGTELGIYFYLTDTKLYFNE